MNGQMPQLNCRQLSQSQHLAASATVAFRPTTLTTNAGPGHMRQISSDENTSLIGGTKYSPPVPRKPMALSAAPVSTPSASSPAPGWANFPSITETSMMQNSYQSLNQTSHLDALKISQPGTVRQQSQYSINNTAPNLPARPSRPPVPIMHASSPASTNPSNPFSDSFAVGPNPNQRK
jgi:hypothetical protein